MKKEEIDKARDMFMKAFRMMIEVSDFFQLYVVSYIIYSTNWKKTTKSRLKAVTDCARLCHSVVMECDTESVLGSSEDVTEYPGRCEDLLVHFLSAHEMYKDNMKKYFENIGSGNYEEASKAKEVMLDLVKRFNIDERYFYGAGNNIRVIYDEYVRLRNKVIEKILKNQKTDWYIRSLIPKKDLISLEDMFQDAYLEAVNSLKSYRYGNKHGNLISHFVLRMRRRSIDAFRETKLIKVPIYIFNRSNKINKAMSKLGDRDKVAEHLGKDESYLKDIETVSNLSFVQLNESDEDELHDFKEDNIVKESIDDLVCSLSNIEKLIIVLYYGLYDLPIKEPKDIDEVDIEENREMQLKAMETYNNLHGDLDYFSVKKLITE